MKYLSVCSGVEAASQAWERLGWEAVAFSEIEPFPCAVLRSRYPNVPNLGDMSKIHYNRETKELTNGTDTVVCDGGIDLLVGGTPCQSFSVAGKRAGLEGASGLACHYARLIGEIRPRWFVWENVPGALSSRTYGDQRDFNFLLHQFAVGGDASLGARWDLCWRVLDTQYVRVEPYPLAIPQRRRRVFVVGHLAGSGGGGCEVLLEPEGVRGYTAPRRVKGQGAAGNPAAGAGGADGALDAINCAMRGNRSASERGKLIESDFERSAYTVTGVQTDSMVAAASGVNCLTPGDHQNARVYGEDGGYPTMRSMHGGTSGADGTAVCVRAFKLDSKASNSMKSANPHSGIHATDVHCALDTTDPNPTKAQGGVAIAVSFKGGQSADGGLGVDEGACQTMQSLMSAIEPTVAISFLPTNSARARSLGDAEEVATTVASASGGSGNKPSVATRSVAVRTGHTGANGCGFQDEVTHTLGAVDRDAVAISIGRDAFNSGANAQMAQSISREVQPPLTAKGPGGGYARELAHDERGGRNADID